MRGGAARPGGAGAEGLLAVAQPRRPRRDGVGRRGGAGRRGRGGRWADAACGLGNGRRRRGRRAAMAARAVLDEFTAPAAKATLLERGRGRIEGLFGVSLAVLGALGAEEPPPARIWVQLRGAQEAVHSAKVSPPAGLLRGPGPAPQFPRGGAALTPAPAGGCREGRPPGRGVRPPPRCPRPALRGP